MGTRHDAIIVGAGQAGLAMSYHLSARGREHVLLERARVAERWLSERWDSLYFQFPNYMVSLPGRKFSGKDPAAFAHRDEIVEFIQAYAKEIKAPVRTGVEVTSIRRGSNGFMLETPGEILEANRVVIATGPFQRPFVPEIAKGLPADVLQITATHYRNPELLPGGAVLVVGSRASGFQIAADLEEAGRKVFLCVSPHRRVPRRYRGHDMGWWYSKMGHFDIAVDSFQDGRFPPSVVVTATRGGYDADARQLADKGVVILGRLISIENGQIGLAGDAEKVLTTADHAYWEFRRQADEFAVSNDLNLPPEPADVPITQPVEPILSLNLEEHGITSVIWSTGYEYDFDWIEVPVMDGAGAPVQKRGVTSCPGLYFLGLHWMHTFKSGLLSGVGEDAEYLADLICQ